MAAPRPRSGRDVAHDRPRDLEAIYRLTTLVSRATTLEEVVSHVLDALVGGFGADRASVLLVDADDVLRFTAWRGLSETCRRAVEGHRPWSGRDTDARPILVPDVAADPGLGDLREVILGEGIRALAVIPLLARGRLIGEFVVYYDAPRRFTDDEVWFVETVAAQVAYAIERTRAEQALAASEERLRLAVEAARLGTWDYDPIAGTLAWCPRAKAIWGLAAEARVTSADFLASIDAEDRPVVEARARAALEHRTDYEAEFRVRRPDGERRWVLARGRPRCDADGRPVRFLGVVQDITDRKRVEDELRAQREFLDRLIDASADSIKVLDLDGRLLSISAGGQRLMEIDEVAPLLGTSWIDFWRGDDRAAAAAAVARAARGETARFQGYRPTARGAPRWWDVLITPIPGPHGRPERLLAVSRDVTERRSTEQQREATLAREQAARAAAEAASRAKDQFLAMLAHELRNPLAPIATALALIERQVGDRAVVLRAAAIAARQTRHLARLIDDLLDVARITSGKIALERRPTDLVEVVRDAVEAARQAGKAADRHVTLALPGEPVVVRGDRVRLEQIVGNLLDNALKYTRPGGAVAVSLAVRDAEAVISVRDDGIGIGPELLPVIFDLFTQGDQTLDRGGGGLGLGLTLVKTLVERHGGAVRAHSAGGGQGSEFVVTLPVVREPLPAAPPAPAAAAAPRPRTVLLVEDNDDARELLRVALELAGHRVVVARDGLEALEAAAAAAPDAMLVDIGIPGIDGYELARRVRAGPGGRDVLLVALTGYGRAEDRAAALAAGFDLHVVKPVDPAVLEHLLAEGRPAAPAR